MRNRGRPALLKPSDKMELRLMREAGVSIKDACGYFGVSIATGMRILADLRKKLGPEKLPRRQTARSHLYTSQNSASNSG
jgi:hypothetical protein